MGAVKRGAIAAGMYVVLASGPVTAQSPADKALATELFQEGRALMAAGRIADACLRFTDSQRLDPAPGTLLNLALCHEKQGLTGRAWAEFKIARVQAQRDGRSDRIAFADEHVAELEKVVSRLKIIVNEDADEPALQITRSGQVVPRSAWGKALPVDPGTYRVEASAPAKQSATVEVVVGGRADVQTVVIPKLITARGDEPAEPTTTAVIAPALTPSRLPAARVTTPLEPDTKRSPPRLFATVAGAVGLAGIGTGSYFGLRAFSKRRESDDECLASRCTDRAVELNESAKAAADISTGAFVIGVAGLAAGTLLWLSGDAAARKVTAASVGPVFSQHGGSVVVRGRL